MSKLVITDLDETLLVKGNLLVTSKKHIETILASNKVKFTVASARNIHSIKNKLGSLNIEYPVISYGGAYISDIHTEQHLYTFSLDVQLLKEIVSTIRSFNLDPFFYLHSTETGKDTIYYRNITCSAMNWCLTSDSYFKDQDFVSYTKSSYLLKLPIVRLILKDQDEVILKLKKKLDQKFSNFVNIYMYPSWYIKGHSWLIVLSKEANKLSAINVLCQHLGESIENVIYYGDSLNDLCVFESNINSIAVSNSTDEIKKLAKKLIGSNIENSVTTDILNTFEI